MTSNNDILSIETDTHTIEISEGCLTIGTKKFPDDCVSLTPEETETVLKLLLLSKDMVLKLQQPLKVDVYTINVF
jgi:hypothetical protein